MVFKPDTDFDAYAQRQPVAMSQFTFDALPVLHVLKSHCGHARIVYEHLVPQLRIPRMRYKALVMMWIVGLRIAA